MDKNNKKGQTFSDLFSNINSDKKEEINFNNISNESNNKDNVTLENLFKETEKKESKQDDFSETSKPNPPKDSSKKELSLQNIFEKTKESSQDNPQQESSKNINQPKSSDIFQLEKNPKEETPKTEKENSNSNIEKNNIFDNNKLESNTIDNRQNIETDFNNTESSPITKLSSLNIFEQDNKIEDKTNKLNEEQDNIENTSINDSIAKDNIFDDKSKITNKVENNQNNDEPILENNIFFSNNKDDLEEKKDNQKSLDQIDKMEPNETEQDFKNEPLISENPFFAEENPSKETNPFFDNKINLIEKEKHDTNNDLTNKIDTSNVKHFNVKIVNKKEPLIKFVLGVLSYAAFIWLLLIGITLLIYVADLKIRQAKGDNSTPTFNAYVVLTGSMLPDIQVYDVVVTKKIEAKELQEGDIITFSSSDTRFAGTTITHRIIRKYYDSENKTYNFQTKGDNNNVADSALVQPSNIYGKVILKIPKLGYLQEFLASDGGWIIVILIPCLAVISYDIVKLIKGLKRKKYKNIKVQK